MKYDMDCFSAREASPKFQSCLGWKIIWKINPVYLEEMAVLLATPGFRDNHFRYMFSNYLNPTLLKEIRRTVPVNPDHVQENINSITERDGEVLCRMFAKRRAGGMPYWGQAWLNHKFHQGYSTKQLAAMLDVSPQRIHNLRKTRHEAISSYQVRRPIR